MPIEINNLAPNNKSSFYPKFHLNIENHLEGRDWYPFALDLRGDDGSFLNILIDISASSYFKISFAQRSFPFSLLNW